MNAFSLAKSIVSKLVKAGFTAYFAGGWVRDYVMGHPSEDIDIATSAAPVEIMNLFPNTILVGLSFGVVIVVLEGHQFEVASFRKDLPYIDGRHPIGIEMSNPEEDALRRDFTINGMFYDPLSDLIHDFVHGREDIKQKVIRTIGDPEERFFEDRLRMLRAFRFSSRFGFSIHSDTQAAILDNADKLFPSVAMERVWQELTKMAAYPRFDQAIIDMHRLSILEAIFPELKGCHLHDLRHRIEVYSQFPSNCPAIIYIRELFLDLPLEQKIEMCKRLRIKNKDIHLMEFLDKLFAAINEERQENILDRQKWAYLMSHPDFQLGMQIFMTRLSEKERENYGQLIEKREKDLQLHIERIQSGKPLVSASYLQNKGIKPGKKMGLLLKAAEKISINENIHEPETVFNHLSKMPIWNHDTL
jgi:poly(A) polymerase